MVVKGEETVSRGPSRRGSGPAASFFAGTKKGLDRGTISWYYQNILIILI